MIKKITYKNYLKYEYLINIERQECIFKEETAEYYFDTTIHRHDKLFRDLLSNKKEVCSFLKEYLNLSIEEQSLIPYKTTFITNDFKNRESDIIYKIKDKKVFILIEHQTKIDYSMSYRIINYSLEIIRNFIRSEKIQNKNYEYPQIIPIVIYTGNNKWNAKRKFSQMQEKYDSNIQNNMEMSYNLIDINRYSKERLEKSNLLISKAFIIEKCKTKEELIDTLEKMIIELKTKEERETLQRMIKYILYGVLEKEEIESLLQKMNREEGGVNMLRENLMKEREGWFKQGEKKGEKRGEKKSIITIVKSMLSYGEEEEKIKKYTGMTENQIKKIKKELEMVH